jgi:asparagine synthase (glutamine-hydrolysing)
MCGIVGKVNADPARPVEPALLARMQAAIRPRGPDGEGHWLRAPAGLGFRRLAIIDLQTGDQPMFNEDRSLAIVFNGEIYNFQELRGRLEALGHVFASHSDTEVIVHGYEQWGPAVVQELRGMFAFAIYDCRQEALFLARDRFGKKPLYYAHLKPGSAEEAMLFASDLKALLAEPGLPRHLDPVALHHYLTYGYVPEPGCILEGIAKLPPAHWLLYRQGKLQLQRYWELEYEPKSALAEAAAIAATREQLEEAVRVRLISDVPIGCYLSSGIDSAAIVALARRHLPGRLQTFSATIAGVSADYNELEPARQVARHLGTEHHELVIEPKPAEVLAGIPWKYGEPNAQLSAVSFFYLHRWGASQVKVMLSGDAGDEDFVGYEGYRHPPERRRWWGHLPAGFRQGMQGPMLALAGCWRDNVRLTKLYSRWRRSLMDEADLYVDRRLNFPDYHRAWILSPAERQRSLAQAGDSEAIIRAYTHAARPSELIDRMMWSDWHMHMSGMTFPKIDRLSMAHGMEIRSPFCDHRLAEFAARQPMELKFKNRTLKWLLKEAVRDLVPPSVFEIRKTGFGDPDISFFREPMRQLAEDLLFDETARSRGLFDQRQVRRIVDQHLSGRCDHRTRFWSLLILEAWCRTFLDRPDPLAGPLDLGIAN